MLSKAEGDLGGQSEIQSGQDFGEWLIKFQAPLT